MNEPPGARARVALTGVSCPIFLHPSPFASPFFPIGLGCSCHEVVSTIALIFSPWDLRLISSNLLATTQADISSPRIS
jgi:hypothetical protein